MNNSLPEMDPSLDRAWVLAGTAMTLALALVIIVLAPPGITLKTSIAVLPIWLLAGVIVYLADLLRQTLLLMREGSQSPLMGLNLRGSPIVVGGYLLAGLNMVLFMCIKPLLNIRIPFRADPLLSRVDAFLFLGHQPGNLLAFLNSDGLAIFYHRGWFVLMVLALVNVLQRPASREKSALLVTYFALWTLAGPIVHALLPAGGPLFFERLTGEPFAVPSAETTRQLSDALWTYYTKASFAPGAGISAMPSMHIATTAWIFLVYRQTRFAVPVALCAILIFALSIALGWHYFCDGVVGAALCWAIFKASTSLTIERRLLAAQSA